MTNTTVVISTKHFLAYIQWETSVSYQYVVYCQQIGNKSKYNKYN